MARREEELPQMDGSCDACEPDEAQPATQVCHTCNFAFCIMHGERHASRTHHPLSPYKPGETQNKGACTKKDSGAAREAEDEAESNPAAAVGSGQEKETPIANGDEDAEEEAAAQSRPLQDDGPVNGAEGAEARQAAAEDKPKNGKGDARIRDRLHCKEHDKEGTLYCKSDEKIICVVCAVQGEHRDHEIITLREAYMWQKSRDGYGLLNFSQQMGERINEKWTKGKMPIRDLEKYVSEQFQELCKLVRLEEKRYLHLVDLKEAFFTAAAAEKIAEINSETERLQEEMADVTRQIAILEQARSPAEAMEALVARPRSAPRAAHNVGARLRLPEPRAAPTDPRDLDDKDSGPSMEHGP